MKKKIPRVRSVDLIVDRVVVLVENVPLRKGEKLYDGRKYITGTADLYFHVHVKGRRIHISGVTFPGYKNMWIGANFLVEDTITKATYCTIAAEVKRHVLRILDTKPLGFKV